SNTLVIGYGNEWRADDGVGPEVARRIGRLGMPGVRVLSVHQLTPELAEDLSAVDRAVFIDACLEHQDEGLAIQSLAADDDGTLSTHVCHPRALLVLAGILYG